MRPGERRRALGRTRRRVHLFGKQERRGRVGRRPLEQLPAAVALAQAEPRLGEPERADDPGVLRSVVGVPLVAGDAPLRLAPQAVLDRVDRETEPGVVLAQETELEGQQDRGVQALVPRLEGSNESPGGFIPEALERRRVILDGGAPPAARVLAEL